MPRKKIKPQRPRAKDTRQIKWPESYTSLILGIIVVIVIAILLISFVKSRKTSEVSSDKTQRTTESQGSAQGENSVTYVVIEGDNLWNISDKYYNTGYKWVDIAKENNLANPDLIEVGTKLKISKPEQKEVVSDSISGLNYTVKQGEYLWEIAVRAYGDGYKWVDIAKANNLINPDLIHTGNVFVIPR